MFKELSIENIVSTRKKLGNRIITTPAIQWQGPELKALIGDDVEVFVKLELFQQTGTFKPRGAMNVMMNLSQEQLDKGITAVSAGNHAIAASYCAKQMGTTAKIFMPKVAKPFRVKRAQEYGAEIIFCDTQQEMFERAQLMQKEEGRTFVHPFDGPYTVQGTATAGLEFTEQVPELDVMILPIGGGGLCAGFAAALKQVWPNITVIGVEPEGANTMSLSFAAGKAIRKNDVKSIADSLAPPMAEEYTYSVCKAFVDEIVTVSDEQIIEAMKTIFYDLKLAVEPAGASTTAALCGPLKGRFKNQRIGVITCGSNIDIENFYELTGAKKS
jgi:threonine dehydratase